jgi:hypothetical protein
MVIALIVNSEGFPFSYETFDGNRADVSTMETILRMVERKIWRGPPDLGDGSGHRERGKSGCDWQARGPVSGGHCPWENSAPPS